MKSSWATSHVKAVISAHGVWVGADNGFIYINTACNPDTHHINAC
jgi:hypothetical protein